MKFFLTSATFLIASLILAQEQKDNHFKSCIKETGVSLHIFSKALQGEFIDDPKLKSTILCIFKKNGISKQNGALDTENIKAKLEGSANEEKNYKLVDKCRVTKDSPEQTAFEALKCLYGIFFNLVPVKPQ